MKVSIFWGISFSNNACLMTALVVMQCSNPVLMLIRSCKGGKKFMVGFFLRKILVYGYTKKKNFFKVMSTIASELKAPSQNTPHSGIII